MFGEGDQQGIGCADPFEEVMRLRGDAVLVLSIGAVDRHLVIVEIEEVDPNVVLVLQQPSCIVEQLAVDRVATDGGSEGEHPHLVRPRHRCRLHITDVHVVDRLGGLGVGLHGCLLAFC